ncbi:MAG: peroxidase family protein [Pirellulales bacterium]
MSRAQAGGQTGHPGNRHNGKDRERLRRRAASFETLENRPCVRSIFAPSTARETTGRIPNGEAQPSKARTSPAEYGDGISTPAGADRKCLAISNLLADQGEQSLVNNRGLSAFVHAWGQFLDHDIDLTNLAQSRRTVFDHRAAGRC